MVDQCPTSTGDAEAEKDDAAGDVAEQADAAADAEMNWVIAVVTQIRTLRSEMNVPAAARLKLTYKDAGAAAKSGRLALSICAGGACRPSRRRVWSGALVSWG